MKFKDIALPREYGVWGLLAEAFLVGFCLAPTKAGLLLGFAALSLFCFTQPAKGVLKNRSLTRGTLFFMLLYATLGLLALTQAAALSSAPFWRPMIAGLILSLAQLMLDFKNQGRSFLSETAGGSAVSSLAAVILIAGGKPSGTAFAIWGLLCLRIFASVTYVRNKLRLAKGREYSPGQVFWVHGLALTLLLVFTRVHFVPWPVTLGFTALCLNAALGMLKYQVPVKARTVGFQQMAFGILYSLCIILGYWK